MEVDYGVFAIPADWNWPTNVRVFVGGCVERGEGSSFRRMAHAHNRKTSEWFGWICIRSRHRVATATGRPTVVSLHEYAHMLAPNQGHTMKWANALAYQLGQPKEAVRCCKPFAELMLTTKVRKRRLK